MRSLDQPALTSLNQPGRSHGRLCFQALIPGAVCVPMHPMKCKNINKTTPFATPTAQLSHYGHALAAYGVETGHPINAGEIQGLKLISLRERNCRGQSDGDNHSVTPFTFTIIVSRDTNTNTGPDGSFSVCGPSCLVAKILVIAHGTTRV